MNIGRQVRHWWLRRCGGRDVLRMSLPLIISTMSFTIMHFCDRMFLAWYSTDAMAAAMPAGGLHWTMISLPLGMAMYANTFIAQYYGADRKERIGAIVWHALRIGLYATPVFLFLAPFAPALFRAFGHSEDLMWLEVIYFQVLAFGSGAAVMGAGLAAYFIGQGKTRVVMYVNIAASLLNILLDWILIFGQFGSPALGIQGAAWATVISQWFRIAFYFVLVLRCPDRHEYGFARGRRFDRRLMLRIFRFGGPNGLQFVIEGSAITVFILIMARLGKTAAAATTLAFSINMVAFVPMLGVGTAVSTLVGQQIGRGRVDLAARATWTSLKIGLAYSGFFGLLYVAAPGIFLVAHAAGSDEFEPVRSLTVILLRFVAAYVLLDTVQLIFVSAIKGAGDTLFVLGTTVLWSVTFVAVGILGDRIAANHSQQIYWWWMMITVWIWILAVVYVSRFLLGRWKHMKVIEHAADPPENEELVANEELAPVTSN